MAELLQAPVGDIVHASKVRHVNQAFISGSNPRIGPVRVMGFVTPAGEPLCTGYQVKVRYGIGYERGEICSFTPSE